MYHEIAAQLEAIALQLRKLSQERPPVAADWPQSTIVPKTSDDARRDRVERAGGLAVSLRSGKTVTIVGLRRRGGDRNSYVELAGGRPVRIDSFLQNYRPVNL